MYLSPDILPWMQCSYSLLWIAHPVSGLQFPNGKLRMPLNKYFNGTVLHLKLKSEGASTFRCISSCVPAASEAETHLKHISASSNLRNILD